MAVYAFIHYIYIYIYMLLHNIYLIRGYLWAKILKYAASVITPSSTNLFNSSIEMEIFPSEWKIAIEM